MRIGAMVLGIIGGLSGLIMGILGLLGGMLVQTGWGQLFGVGGGAAVGMFALLPVSIMGLVGGAIANTKAGVAGILMILSAIIMFLLLMVTGGAVEVFLYIFPGLLLLIGGILALVSR